MPKVISDVAKFIVGQEVKYLMAEGFVFIVIIAKAVKTSVGWWYEILYKEDGTSWGATSEDNLEAIDD